MPSNKVQMFAPLLQELEQTFQGRLRIDMEMNSLEDAYINIAREEERLLAQMPRRRASLQHDALNATGEASQEMEASELADARASDLEKYTSAVASPTLKRQAWSNFKRRLLQFRRQPRQILMTLMPFINLMMQVLWLDALFEHIGNQQAADYILAFLLPFLIAVGICLSPGVYVITGV